MGDIKILGGSGQVEIDLISPPLVRTEGVACRPLPTATEFDDHMEKPMITSIAFDYYHTLTDDPRMVGLFHALKSFGLRVGIISAYGDRQGDPAGYLKKIDEFLEDSNLKADFVQFVHFDRKEDIPDLKLQCCRMENVGVAFDDRADVCKKLTENGILALQFTRKEKVE